MDLNEINDEVIKSSNEKEKKEILFGLRNEVDITDEKILALFRSLGCFKSFHSFLDDWPRSSHHERL